MAWQAPLEILVIWQGWRALMLHSEGGKQMSGQSWYEGLWFRERKEIITLNWPILQALLL